MRQFLTGVLDEFFADGTAIANSASEALVYRSTKGMGAGFMHGLRRVRVRFFGKLSTTGAPTLTARIRFGNDLSGTLIGLTETLTMGSGVSNVNWLLDAMIKARADGATGKLFCSGSFEVHTGATTLLRSLFSVSGYDAPAEVTADLDGTANLATSLQWGTGDPANTATPMDGLIQALN